MASFNTYERGDVVMVNFDPSVGHEQKGYRPALVWTNKDSQMVSGFASVFPITSHDKNYPLHVKIDGRAEGTHGVVMTDQIITIDLQARETKKVSHANQAIMDEVSEIFAEMTA